MIQHTVTFRLKHPIGSPEETRFLKEAKKLSLIPAVNRFECLRQVSPKNDYAYGLSMFFKNEKDYQSYNDHPDHVKFVNETWVHEVEKFLEIDYVPLPE